MELAQTAYGRGDLPKALALLREAAAALGPLDPDGMQAATLYDDLGQVLAELGETAEAEAQLRRALALRRTHSPASSKTAESSHNLGMLLWKTRRLSEAEAELRRAIEDLEAQQTRLGGTEEARSLFAAEFADYYRDYLRLLMELGREEDAFLILERYRAGSFLRTLAQRDLGAPGEVPANLERERRSTNAEYDRTQRELGELKPATQSKEIDEVLGRLSDLRRKQTEIAGAIGKASPRYGALRYPQAGDVAAAKAALDPGTLLLSYSVGRDRTYLFALESTGPRGAPGLSVYALPVGEKALRESVDAFRRLILRGAPSPDLSGRSRSLYDALLKPAEALIARNDRILILPDGPLHKLPWAALSRAPARGNPQYLVEWKPLYAAVSATVYSELKRGRKSSQPDLPLAIAAFGDPRYPALRERAVVAVRGEPDEDAEIDTSMDELDQIADAQLRDAARGGLRFVPLPESRAEVNEIGSLYSPRASIYLGADATEERATAIGRDVPLIHYACHAYVNPRFPLDSALVFTIPDQPKEGQDNGLLQAWEIFEKVRIDADLVTLSACESGLGKEMGGEGLIGLTRAFQFAGARSVLASLWKVEDKSTAAADETVLYVPEVGPDEGRGPPPRPDRPHPLRRVLAAQGLGRVPAQRGLEVAGAARTDACGSSLAGNSASLRHWQRVLFAERVVGVQPQELALAVAAAEEKASLAVRTRGDPPRSESRNGVALVRHHPSIGTDRRHGREAGRIGPEDARVSVRRHSHVLDGPVRLREVLVRRHHRAFAMNREGRSPIGRAPEHPRVAAGAIRNRDGGPARRRSIRGTFRRLAVRTDARDRHPSVGARPENVGCPVGPRRQIARDPSRTLFEHGDRLPAGGSDVLERGVAVAVLPEDVC